MTFKHFGIGVKWVTENTPEAFAAAIDDKTKAIFVESIANPKYVVSDLPALAKVKFGFLNLFLAPMKHKRPNYSFVTIFTLSISFVTYLSPG